MKVLQVRIPAEDLHWLDEKAAANGLTRSAVVKLALAAYRRVPPLTEQKMVPLTAVSEKAARVATVTPLRSAYPRDPDDCTHPINYRDNSNRCNACGDQR